MALPKTEAQKSKFARDLLQKQIKLEMQFRPKIRGLFRAIAADAAALYVNNKQVLDVRTFNPDMVALLRAQYRKVIKRFGFVIRDAFGLKFMPIVLDKKNVDQEFTTVSSIYVAEHSEVQTPIIMRTEQKEVFKATENALISLLLLMGVDDVQIASTAVLSSRDRINVLQSMVDSNQTFSEDRKNIELQRRIRGNINKSAIGQSVGIAMTETNNPANFALTAEANLVANDPEFATAAVAAGVIAVDELVNDRIPLLKEWVAILDDKTRATHVGADGQQVSVNDTFTVGGFSMRFPTDGSLGAPAKEIVNCRCKSIPVVP